MAVQQGAAQWFCDTFEKIVANIGQAVLGKEHIVRLALTCMISEGHLLLEDAPGTGKTALARAIAASVKGKHSRIQFTPDMLPSDITGVTIYDQETKKWNFHPGPIFATIVLADEINRASPKTQSALLEVMEEFQVTVEGESRPVKRPFMVIATQNPIEQAGTYPLPEAQLDRFLMKTQLGYPDRGAMMAIMAGSAQPDRSKALNPVVETDAIVQMSKIAATNPIDETVLDYIYQIVELTRQSADVRLGVSTRGAIAMARASRVWAFAQGRNYVLPDDIQILAEPVWAHRLVMDPDAVFAGARPEQVIAQAVQSVPVPTGYVQPATGAQPQVAQPSPQAQMQQPGAQSQMQQPQSRPPMQR